MSPHARGNRCLPACGDAVFDRYDDSSQPGVRYPHMGIYVDDATVLDARFGAGVGYHPHVQAP